MRPLRMTEREFQSQVLGLAKIFHWRRAHFRAARTAKGWRTPVEADGKGWPDLTLVKGQRLVFAELKRDGEKPSPEQEAWLEALRRVPGVEVYVWTPKGWPEIERVLTWTC